MKSTCLFFVLLFTTSLCAQDRVSYKQSLDYTNTGEVVLKEILHYPGKSKSELYQMAEEWFARKFSGEPLQFDAYSEDRSKLIGRGFFSYQFFIVLSEKLAEVSYVLTISVKDEKIKVEMEEIFILGETSLINIEDEFLLPKPAHEVISDEALYKKNGKPRKIKRRHKEKILSYWYETLDSVDGFFRTTREEDDW